MIELNIDYLKRNGNNEFYHLTIFNICKSEVKRMDHIIKSYENYKEEDRLSSNNARKIEFITSIRAIKDRINKKAKILDCAAGTGIYSFELAHEEHEVTALDLTPRHVSIMKDRIKSCNFTMDIDVNDATDLSRFDDETFDVVLCMGPIYHLVDENLRQKCLKECYRVLRKGGILVLAYISRYYVFPYIATQDKKYLNLNLGIKINKTGTIHSNDPDCFWTDCFFATPEEIESYMIQNGLKVLDHLASDGISPFISDKIDALTESEFKVWCDYHYSVCRERSILGSSNHGLIIGRK